MICVAGIYNFEFVLNKVSDNLKEKLNNSFLINEEENLHINVVKYIKNCENNPIDQGRVSKELVYYVPLKNLLIFDDFILAIREINDEFQIFIYRKDYISDSPLLFSHIKLNESLKYETAGVYDAKIWYEIMITN